MKDKISLDEIIRKYCFIPGTDVNESVRNSMREAIRQALNLAAEKAVIKWEVETKVRPHHSDSNPDPMQRIIGNYTISNQQVIDKSSITNIINLVE